MTAECTIEQIPPDRWTHAARFLVAGCAGEGEARPQVDACRRLLAAGGEEGCRFWQARREGVVCGAALIARNPGRTGMSFYAPPEAPGVDADADAACLRTASRAAIDEGLTMLQALPGEEDLDDVRLLERAGYERLAELVYMARPVGEEDAANDGEAADDAATVLTVDQFGEDRLASLLRRTYESTLDCPGLQGVRTAEEILEGHRHTARYNPESWWVLTVRGRPVGCCFLNVVANEAKTELVYLGVVPEARGTGASGRLLACAVAYTRRTLRKAIRLAVDAGNDPAVRLYRRWGFAETMGRIAFVYTWRTRGLPTRPGRL